MEDSATQTSTLLEWANFIAAIRTRCGGGISFKRRIERNGSVHIDYGPSDGSVE